MILSKFMTAKSREAIAAPEMSARVTMRSREEVFATVAGDKFDGREYAEAIATELWTQVASRIVDFGTDKRNKTRCCSTRAAQRATTRL